MYQPIRVEFKPNAEVIIRILLLEHGEVTNPNLIICISVMVGSGEYCDKGNNLLDSIPECHRMPHMPHYYYK